MRGSLIGVFVAVSPALLAAVWTVRIEEPTGIYRRTAEVVRIPLSKLGASRTGFRVADDKGRYSDAHVYHGWYDGSIWEYTAMPQPFVSELGATSLPNYESLMRFLPVHWPIRGHEEDWIFHKLQISEGYEGVGRTSSPLQEYIARTQAYTARLFQLALERSRRLM